MVEGVLNDAINLFKYIGDKDLFAK